MRKEYVIGGIEYLAPSGIAVEFIEYSDPEQFIKDAKENTFYGVPYSLILYRDEQGKTIPQDFLTELAQPPQGFRIEDTPCADYRLLEKLCDEFEHFIEAQTYDERDLWNGSIVAHMGKIRELYNSLPRKPFGITEALIDGYEQDIEKNLKIEQKCLTDLNMLLSQDAKTPEQQPAQSAYEREVMEY